MNTAITAKEAAGGMLGAGFSVLLASFDQGMALAALGGCFFFLGVSASFPVSTRVFFSLGSCILGYMCGMLTAAHEGWVPFAGVTAFGVAALGSTVFGSLHAWGQGGPTPRWILLLIKLIPYRRG